MIVITLIRGGSLVCCTQGRVYTTLTIGVTIIDSMPTKKAEFGFWENRHFFLTNRPTLK